MIASTPGEHDVERELPLRSSGYEENAVKAETPF